ncbi:hypothetical protein IAT38_003880 [Cryptococcus sp. DSM 104549]
MLRPTFLRAARPLARLPATAAPRSVRFASGTTVEADPWENDPFRRWVKEEAEREKKEADFSFTEIYGHYPVPPGEEPDPQLNGYPQLPWEDAQTRQPFGWWDMQGRRNYGEILHQSHDILNMWGPDLHKTTWYSALGQLTLAFGLLGTFAYTMGVNHLERPAIAREYPYNGLEKELGGFPARIDREEQE